MIVADDDPGIRLVCRINLELEGYRVLEASNAAETRRCVRDADDAVMLLDSRLGPDDGVALGDELRATRPDLAIALMTGDSRVHDAAVRAFAARVIRKPFTLDQLLETVRELAPH